MKNKLFLLVFFLITTNVFAENIPQYRVIHNTNYYEFDYDHFSATDKLSKNSVVELDDNWSCLFYDLISIKSISHSTKGDIYPKYITPLKTKDIFDSNVITDNSNNEFSYLPTYYLELLVANERNKLPLEYEPHIKNINQYDDYSFEAWFLPFEINNYVIIYNSLIGIGYGNGCSPNCTYDLNVISIEKKSNGYDVIVTNGKSIQKILSEDKIETQVLNKSWLLNGLPSYMDYTPYMILLRFDGDYLSMYVNDENHLLQTFFKANKNTKKEILELIKTEKCDLSRVTWPRHADGTCDYDNSSSIKTVAAQPSTNVSEMSVTENLKLRSGEATTTSVLTVMAAGTKVKILELGKAENIDGIDSNWVKVEVQKGAKDRNGKEIKAGTVGWCYGGYLK